MTHKIHAVLPYAQVPKALQKVSKKLHNSNQNILVYTDLGGCVQYMKNDKACKYFLNCFLNSFSEFATITFLYQLQ